MLRFDIFCFVVSDIDDVDLLFIIVEVKSATYYDSPQLRVTKVFRLDAQYIVAVLKMIRIAVVDLRVS